MPSILDEVFVVNNADFLITMTSARAHLRLEDDYPPEQLQVYISAACQAAAHFLNRRIYATTDEQSAAIAGVPAALVLAVTARDTALTAADLVTDAESRCAARDDAETTLRAARAAAVEIRRSIVADDTVRAAVQLILGHLYQNRQDATTAAVTELPMGSRALLQPLRIGLGV